MTTDLILGTAGHIDHGKTSLIRVLTGVNTDRLPEEKKRGITIELGFAELVLEDYRLGIVDVPGHEKFVRNMLAGATGMDIALLVVAADDSIKQQTREHLEILRMLDLPVGVIALTKCDLVDPDWLPLVEDEIRELVAGTFLADAPIVQTSSTTGMGIDLLKDELLAAAHFVADTKRMHLVDAPFRMAIDRTFTIAGHGTVVTGSASSGRVQVGDELVIEPGGIHVRVRGLQNHDRVVQEVHRGQRTAINLAGVHHDQTDRGQELASVGHLEPSKLVTLSLTLLPNMQRPLKNRARVRMHVGTAELLTSIILLGRDQLEPGETCVCQAFLSAEAVTVWNQPFVLRSESPITTIGGGRVLVPAAHKLKNPDDVDFEMLDKLQSGNQVERASAALFFAGLRNWQPSELSRTAGVEAIEETVGGLVESGEMVEINLSPQRTFRLHRQVLERLSHRIAAALQTMHEKEPLRSTVDLSKLLSGFDYLGERTFLLAVLEHMKQAGVVRLTDRGVGLVGQGPQLSKNERALMAQLIRQYQAAGFESPTVKQCQQEATKNQQSVPQLIQLAAADGDLVEITNDYFMHVEAEQSARDKLSAMLAESEGLTLSEIRGILGTSRKYAVPFCEYLDRVGFTQRKGDKRVLANLGK